MSGRARSAIASEPSAKTPSAMCWSGKTPPRFSSSAVTSPGNSNATAYWLPPGRGACWWSPLDGIEICSSYVRCCPNCMEREIERKVGEQLCKQIQYYHRLCLAHGGE